MCQPATEVSLPDGTLNSNLPHPPLIDVSAGLHRLDHPATCSDARRVVLRHKGMRVVAGGSFTGILTSSLLQALDLVPEHVHAELNSVSAVLAGLGLAYLARAVIPHSGRFGVTWQVDWDK
jgi:hypothetical protein